MPEKTSSGGLPPSTISVDMVAEVDRLAVPGDLFVDGSVIGRVDVAGRLVIREGAVVRGNVKAHSAVVAGALEGDVVSRDDFKLMSSGSVSGSVCARNVTVEQGARCSALIASGGRSTPTDERIAAAGRYRNALASAASATGRTIEPSPEYAAWAERPPIGKETSSGPRRLGGTPMAETDATGRRGWSKSVRDATVASRTAGELGFGSKPAQIEGAPGDAEDAARPRMDEFFDAPEIDELFEAPPTGDDRVDPKAEDASAAGERKALEP